MVTEIREVMETLPKRLVESLGGKYLKGEVYRGCIDRDGDGGPCITCSVEYGDKDCRDYRRGIKAKVVGRDLFEGQAKTHDCNVWWYDQRGTDEIRIHRGPFE